jgi:ribose/xylose/arabinose/galactoside ABC-type transport system permease subunit
MTKAKDGLINYLTLFSSTGTLLCCALPTLLVSLGLGAVMAGLATHVPGLIWVSEHKIEVFIFAGTMLTLNGLLIWTQRNAPCPVDPKLRDSCIKGRRFSRNIYYISLLIFAIGFFFAFVASKIF